MIKIPANEGRCHHLQLLPIIHESNMKERREKVPFVSKRKSAICFREKKCHSHRREKVPFAQKVRELEGGKKFACHSCHNEGEENKSEDIKWIYDM